MTIEITSIDGLKPVKALYTAVTAHLRNSGILQWDRFYPNRWVISKDLKNGHLHAIMKEGTCIGAVVINEEQSSKYRNLPWQDQTGRPGVIHRLAVHPDSQGHGIGKQLLQYAEKVAKAKGFTSIRLDAFTANPTAIKMYERYGYQPVAQIHFHFRKQPFQCFEKIL